MHHIEGSYVRHASFGLGKVLRLRKGKFDVWFADKDRVYTFPSDATQIESASDVKGHPQLDSLPQFVEDDKGALQLPAVRKGKVRLTLDKAKRKFLEHFPHGFEDPAYIGDRRNGERSYKWKRHELYLELLGNGRGEQLLADGALDELALRVYRVGCEQLNLVDPAREAPLFRDALAPSDASRSYFEMLFAMLAEPAPTPDTFEAYANALRALPKKRLKVATWPIATLLPYLAQPDKYNFLKPTPTQAVAAILTFDLRYNVTPQWDTYSAYLDMSKVLLDSLTPLGARDYIDVQSFMWVVCGQKSVDGGLPQGAN